MLNTILTFSFEDITIWIWLGVFVATLTVEAFTQDLVSIWFTLGSFASLCISQFSAWWVEIIVFVVISITTLILTRPLVKKIMRSQIRNTNTDDFVGKKVKVLTDITKFEMGTVKLNSIVYNAVLMEESNDEIKADSIVEIVSIKGNKFVVRKVEE